MAGHSKWANITQEGKETPRAKIFTKIGEIAVR